MLYYSKNMIEIKKAKPTEYKILNDLSRVTYIESHGHFIEDKNDLEQYVAGAFSENVIQRELNDSRNVFYIVWHNDQAVGYAKIILDETREGVDSNHACRLERIYILNDFLHLKIGQQLLDFVEQKAKSLNFDRIWLTVYVKNMRAIRFYERNDFKNVSTYDFSVNGTAYANTVYVKKI